jgi:hypothetical protein
MLNEAVMKELSAHRLDSVCSDGPTLDRDARRNRGSKFRNELFSPGECVGHAALYDAPTTTLMRLKAMSSLKSSLVFADSASLSKPM